jgi:Icc-related predicted phosphoesterase
MVGAVAGSIIATIMLIHITNEEAALAVVHAPPHNARARNELNAGRSDDCIHVTDHAAAVAKESAT